MPRSMKIGPITIARGGPLFLIAGPCVIEDERSPFDIARRLKETTDALGVPFVFKASFDKANRTSLDGARGPGPAQCSLREYYDSIGPSEGTRASIC